MRWPQTASMKCLRGAALAAAFLTAAGSAAQAQQDSDATFVLPPLEELGAIVDRPLFARDRRPVETGDTDSAPAASGEEAAEPSSQILLAGTAIDQLNRAVAILHDVSRGIDFRVWVGDEVGGWTIKAIKRRMIVLTADMQEAIVTLDEPALPAAPSGR